ncbi:MAG: modulator of FtsH protease HflK [Desulfonauticus sp.]|jgi:membrane protease subunit HflK|nr:modulator of FtsH protease HflK [Desulfonauticus sp.]
MNWDWEKLQQQRERQGFTPKGPDLGDFKSKWSEWRKKLPGGSILLLIVLVLWGLSGIYIVEPDEVGVVQRFGKFHRITTPGPHYHFPFPIEKVQTPKVTRIQRIEIGFRTLSKSLISKNIQYRLVPEESLMLTGDENIIDVQFIVQYQIKDPKNYLFNIADPEKTVKDAAEAAMREVIGYNKIDSALTSGKLAIQNDARELLQTILDKYKSGIRVVAVQLQDVHPPRQVVDAFKDVASAKEDKIRYINEAEAYRNDLIPKTRGEVAAIINEAMAYKESVVRKARGETSRFLSVLKEYKKAKDITRKRLYLETLEEILASPNVRKIIFTDKSLERVVPYLPLNKLEKRKGE